MASPKSQTKEGCGKDFSTFCADKTLGKGLGKCVEKHRKDLSPACLKEFKALENSDAAINDCAETAYEFCGEKTIEQGLIGCLEEHFNELAPSCRSRISQIEKEMKGQ